MIIEHIVPAAKLLIPDCGTGDLEYGPEFCTGNKSFLYYIIITNRRFKEGGFFLVGWLAGWLAESM